MPARAVLDERARDVRFPRSHHALAGELTLKPVLSENGCSCPTPALFLLDSAWQASPELDTWVERARDVLRPPAG